jgi:hypothetical protein
MLKFKPLFNTPKCKVGGDDYRYLGYCQFKMLCHIGKFANMVGYYEDRGGSVPWDERGVSLPLP